MTTRRRPAPAPRERLPERWRRFFEAGQEFGPPDAATEEERWGVAFEPEHVRAAIWNEHQRELLAEWIKKNPGSRPWAWWKYTAPAPRQVLQRTTGMLAEGDWAWRAQRGNPVYVNPGDPPGHVVVESEPAYLRRLGLLQAGEPRRLARAAFEAETVEGRGEDETGDTEEQEEKEDAAGSV